MTQMLKLAVLRVLLTLGLVPRLRDVSVRDMVLTVLHNAVQIVQNADSMPVLPKLATRGVFDKNAILLEMSLNPRKCSESVGTGFIPTVE